MERNFDHIHISPEEVMLQAIQQGSISLYQYLQWQTTDKSWKNVKKAIKKSIIAKRNQQ